MIIEFRVDDVDKEYERLKTLVSEWVLEPTTMPWGNRSILRDPDGNLVNLFTPVHRRSHQQVHQPLGGTACQQTRFATTPYVPAGPGLRL